jgi:AraC family transcriptional regulator of arabinose operon
LIDHLQRLLKGAVLSIVDFNIQTRSEMRTFSRTLPWYVMSYHKEGKANLRVGGKKYEISPGTVILIPPHAVHDHFKDSEGDTVFLWWHFTYEIAGVFDVLKMFDIPITFTLKNSEEFERVFQQFMNSMTSTGHLPAAILQEAKALELLYILLDSAMTSQNSIEMLSQSKAFIGVLAHIIQHPEKEISLQGLADQLHLHPTYISNRFKELFGRAPIQFLREMRIHQAKTLLKTSDLSVIEIVNSLGFSGHPVFTRLFKSYVGISPSQYRVVHRKGKGAKYDEKTNSERTM